MRKERFRIFIGWGGDVKFIRRLTVRVHTFIHKCNFSKKMTLNQSITADFHKLSIFRADFFLRENRSILGTKNIQVRPLLESLL